MLSKTNLRLIVGILIFILPTVSAMSQPLYNQAHKALTKGDYKKSQDLFKDLLKDGSDNPFHHLEAGLSYWYSDADREKSIPHFKNALKNFKPDTVYETMFYLGQALHYDGQFKEATVYLSAFKSKLDNSRAGGNLSQECDKYIAACKVGMTLADQKDPKIVAVPLGDLNSEFPEYAPVIRPGTSVMLFTTRRKSNEGNKVDVDAKYMEDVRAASFNGSNWSEIADNKTIEEHYPIKFNTKRHEGCIYYSPDGNKLWLYKDDQIWISEKSSKGWETPVELPVVINMKKAYTPSATFTADLSTMYFASERKDGTGKRDLYRTTKKGDSWSDPEALSALNTPYDEDAPLLSKDGKTLYFSSEGHNTAGGFDIYKADISDNGEISNIQNMGFPINSPANDIYFYTLDGEDFYLASDRAGTKGSMDIYHYTLEQKPDSIYIAYVLRIMPESNGSKGSVTSSSRNNDSKATLLADDGFGQTKLLRTDSANFGINAAGFKAHNILANQMLDQDSIRLLMELEPLKSFTGKTWKQVLKTSYQVEGETVVLFDTVLVDTTGMPDVYPEFDPIYFDFDQSKINKDDYSILDKVAEYLKSRPKVSIDITGHTDNWGPDKNASSYNERLGSRRAKRASQYLRTKGISRSRMKTFSVGDTKPVVPNKPQTKDAAIKGTKENRRVSFKLYATPAI